MMSANGLIKAWHIVSAHQMLEIMVNSTVHFQVDITNSLNPDYLLLPEVTH